MLKVLLFSPKIFVYNFLTSTINELDDRSNLFLLPAY